MSPVGSVEDRVSTVLWPYVERVAEAWSVPGLAVAVVHGGDQVIARGFGTRDSRSGAPVAEDTLFHVASVSKTFVATAVLQLVADGELDLGASVTAYLPDLPWTDPRARAITVRHLVSHTSGLGDVSDYGWHEPELDDGALGRFAERVAGWTLERDPGEAFAYSNAGFELLGHLVATVGGQPFEDHLARRVLAPSGMATSTFRLAAVPPTVGAQPHHGLPPRAVDGVYPYTRRHAPSSTLHSSAAELGRWVVAHLADGAALMSPRTHRTMWEPQALTGWEHQGEIALGWFCGEHRGHRAVSHSGSDPGFESNLSMLPERGVGVAVLAHSNVVPVFGLLRAGLDVLLGEELEPPPRPPVAVALAGLLEGYGVPAAADLHRRLASEKDPGFDLEDPGFEDAAWGAVEMHRPDLVAPLLELWAQIEPDSSARWATVGWVHEVEGRPAEAVEHLRRALELDPGNDEAAAALRRLGG